MPTEREREYYSMGFRDGLEEAKRAGLTPRQSIEAGVDILPYQRKRLGARKPKRKLSAWNKFVKANSKKPRFRLRSGKLNLKKLGVAFRKTPAGKKKKRR